MILYYPFVNLPDSVFIYLYHLAVVGHIWGTERSV